MTDDLADLIKLTALLRERALDAHRRNLAEAKQFEDELARIDDLRRTVQADTESLGTRRMSGSDTLWQGWLSGRRADILQHSALARARLNDSFDRARAAHARLGAAQAIATDAEKARRTKRIARQEEDLAQLGILKAFPKN